jgi:hypothetical protein
MVFQKGSPGLRRRFTAADQVLGDATFADVDVELEQLPMNARCTPRGFSRHILRIRSRVWRAIAVLVVRARLSNSKIGGSPCDARPQPFPA